ncbi:MAG: ParA family protein [Pyrinomonadaceae bacterium MAG19_C2-C3]|nr:ParA family protein [Pyrinomonadaceae bacterium MAG19_C2-C3]
MRMTRRIQVQNFKGGVGKTTTALHLAHGLSLRGKRVLLIDLDHQANATKGLGIVVKDGQPVFYHLMVKDMSYKEVVVEARPNLFVIPSNELTALAESHIAAEMGREMYLFNKLGDVTEFDYMVVDCAPALSVLHNNALLFSEEMIIPVSMERWAVDGGLDILKSADRMGRVYRRQPVICGVLPWKVDLRTNMTHTVVQILGQAYGSRLLPQIRSDEKFKAAAAEGKTIFEFDAHSKGAQDYGLVTDAVLAQEVDNQKARRTESGSSEKEAEHGIAERIFASA